MTNASLLPNEYFHVFNHAVGDELLFRHPDNYRFFLQRFQSYLFPVVRTYAYCLMPNHFHLLVQVRDEAALDAHYRHLKNLAPDHPVSPDYPAFVMQQFSNFFNSYAKSINKRFKRRGALFIDYMRRKPVRSNLYFTTLLAYIHRNPIHHRFCRTPESWPFSSFQSVISEKPTRLEREAVRDWFGGIEAYILFHRQELTTPSEEDWEFGF